jgi:hypothetical protein
VRKRCENDLRPAQRCIFCCDVSHFTSSDASALPPLLVGGGKCELERGVPRDQPAQLPTRVTARTQDSDRNFMHKECITLHLLCVNDPARPLAQSFLPC